MKRLIKLICLLNFSVLIGSGQEVTDEERVPLAIKDVADFGHCHVAIEGGGKWHSIRSCWVLQRADAAAIKHLPFDEAQELGERKKWNSHCQICQELLQAALVAEDYKNEDEKSRLLAFVNSSDQPPTEPEFPVNTVVEEEIEAEEEAQEVELAEVEEVKIPVAPELSSEDVGGITFDANYASRPSGRVKIPSLSRQLHPRKDRLSSKTRSCSNARYCRLSGCRCR